MNTSNATSTTKAKQSSGLNVKEFLSKYIIYLPFLIISVIISIAISYVYLKYQSPIYSSTISVYFPEESKGSNGADASVLSEVLLFDKKVNLTNEIQVLKSNSLMAKVVERLNLNLLFYKKGKTKLLEYYRNPQINAKITAIKDSSLAETFEIQNLNNKLYWIYNGKQVPINAQTKLAGQNVSMQLSLDPKFLADKEILLIGWQPVMSTASQLSSLLSISQPQPNANILAYGIYTEVPEKGVDILNALVVEHNIRSNEQKDRVVDYTLRFIDERVELMRGELGKVEGNLQQIKTSTLIAPESLSEIGLGEYTTGQEKIKDAGVKLQIINMVKQSVSTPNQPIPSTLGLEDATLSSLVARYNQLLFQKEEQLKTMPAANPMVKLTQSQIDKVRSSILSNLENITASTRSMTDVYRGDVRTGRTRLQTAPANAKQLLEVSRQQEIKEKLFLYLLQRKEEAAITKASNLSTNTIPLDPAVTAGLVSPISRDIYQKGILLALIIPGLIIYLRELLNDKITTRQDITNKTSTPIIGEIFHNEDKTRRVVVSFNERTVMGEQFRMIRANIPLLTKGQDRKVVLISSTTAGEGKTFCSLNLGAVYAIADKKTVILEMDLRKPKIAHSLNIPTSAKGLTHYISDQATLEELPIPVPDVPNLHIITVGIIPPNPSEMLMDDRIGLLFDYLKENFDFIVIDSAPVGLVSDARILAKYADATLYVVRQRKTHKKQLIAVNELYETGIFNNLSLLVNDVKAKGTRSYYYGYGSNHMQNYRYSYGNEKKSFWQRARTVVGL